MVCPERAISPSGGRAVAGRYPTALVVGEVVHHNGPAQAARLGVRWRVSAVLKSIAELNRAAVQHYTALQRHHRTGAGAPAKM